MKKFRILLLLLILCGGGLLTYIFYTEKVNTQLSSSLSPAYQLLGKPFNIANKTISAMLPVSDTDEKKYGEYLALSYKESSDTTNKKYFYLNELLKYLSHNCKKPFIYRAFILNSEEPNAFALPGGVICVTSGLFKVVKNEAQLASVLSHEIGHIERGHCISDIKFELTLKKIKLKTAGELADFAFGFFSSSFVFKKQ